jgi:hypothetical protein
MKEAELRKHATCSLCGCKVLAAGLPLFWRVTVERFGVRLPAVKRQAGLEMMLGSVALAGVFSPGEDLATPVSDPAVLTVCEECCTKPICIAELAMRALAVAESASDVVTP